MSYFHDSLEAPAIDDGHFPFEIAEPDLTYRRATRRGSSLVVISLCVAMAGLMTFFILWNSNLMPQHRTVKGQRPSNSKSKTVKRGIAKSHSDTTVKLSVDQSPNDFNPEDGLSISGAPSYATSDEYSPTDREQQTRSADLQTPNVLGQSSRAAKQSTTPAPPVDWDRIASLATIASPSSDQDEPSDASEVEPIQEKSCGQETSPADSTPSESKKPTKASKTPSAPEKLSAQLAETLKAHDREVNCLKFSPNGRFLVSGGNGGEYISWDVDGYIKKKKGAAVRPIERRNNSDHIVALDFDASGNIFACSGVTHWGNGFGCNLAIFTPYRKEPYGKGCDCAWSWSCVSVDPLARFLVAGSLNRQLKAVSLLPLPAGSGKLRPALTEKSAVIVPNEVWRTHCHPLQPLVAAGGRDGWIRLYTIGMDGLEDSQVQISGHPRGGITGLKFTPNGKHLVSAGQDKLLKIWNLEDGQEIKTIPLLDAIPEWCDLHPTFPWAVIAFQNGRAQIINYETGDEIALLDGHIKSMRSAVFHPEGHWLATAGNDFVVKLWDLGIPSIPLAKRSKGVAKK